MHWFILGAAVVVAIAVVAAVVYYRRTSLPSTLSPVRRQAEAIADEINYGPLGPLPVPSPTPTGSPPRPPVVTSNPSEYDTDESPSSEPLDGDAWGRGRRADDGYYDSNGVMHDYPPGEPPLGLDPNGEWKHAPYEFDCNKAQPCWCVEGKHCYRGH